MKVYKIKGLRISGTDYKEVNKKARAMYGTIKSKSKRNPYIRSVYFNKEKVFLDLFWQHLWEKANFRDKIRRLKLFPCAIELIQKSSYRPISKRSVENKNVMLHRFAGVVNDELFFVQIKEELKTKKKYFISVFPVDEGRMDD
jgi:hypothetical protein